MDAVCFIFLTVGLLIRLMALLLLPRDATVRLWVLLPDTYATVTLPKEDAVEDQGVKKCPQKSNQAVKNRHRMSNQGVKNHRWRNLQNQGKISGSG
jgi:hypothetical protein